MSVLISARADISVGQVINLDISAVRPGEEYEKPKFLGGNHLITEIKWSLSKSELRTNLKVIKDPILAYTYHVYGAGRQVLLPFLHRHNLHPKRSKTFVLFCHRNILLFLFRMGPQDLHPCILQS